jgi:hypothetical protein
MVLTFRDHWVMINMSVPVARAYWFLRARM